jgi:hypothetical protein
MTEEHMRELSAIVSNPKISPAQRDSARNELVLAAKSLEIVPYNPNDPILTASVHLRMIDEVFTAHLHDMHEYLGTNEEPASDAFSVYLEAVVDILLTVPSTTELSDHEKDTQQNLVAKLRYLYTPHSHLFVGYWPLLTPSIVVPINDCLALFSEALLEVSFLLVDVLLNNRNAKAIIYDRLSSPEYRWSSTFATCFHIFVPYPLFLRFQPSTNLTIHFRYLPGSSHYLHTIGDFQALSPSTHPPAAYSSTSTMMLASSVGRVPEQQLMSVDLCHSCPKIDRSH